MGLNSNPKYSVAALAAIRAVCGHAFEIPADRTALAAAGDRLNFGLAAEQAKGEGLRVAMIVVGDDCSLPDKGAGARRGLAGTIMVLKVPAFPSKGGDQDCAYETFCACL